MDIYWIQDHEKKGPLPEVEVISMLEAGLIPETARAWHAGCAEWVRIHDLPAQHLMPRIDQQPLKGRAMNQRARQPLEIVKALRRQTARCLQPKTVQLKAVGRNRVCGHILGNQTGAAGAAGGAF